MSFKLPLAYMLAIGMCSAQYTFTKLVETGPESPYAAVGPYAISSNGIVVLEVLRKDGGGGIYTTTDGNLTRVVDPAGEFAAGVPTGVNASGVVVMSAALDDSSGGVFTVEGGVLKPVVKGVDALGAQGAINDSGAVSFVVKEGGLGLAGGSKVVLSAGGSLKTIADQTGELTGLLLSGGIVNNRSRVAFIAVDLNMAQGGLYIGGDVPLTKVLPASNAMMLVAPALSINDQGAIAFNAANWVTSPTTVNIHVLENGAVRTVVSARSTAGAGPFRSVSTPMINNAGTVAFLGFGHPGFPALGIYTGPDVVKDRVIAAGDPLFGSTVAKIGVYEAQNKARYMDEQSRIMIYYELADGRRGAALAVPGGPSTGNGTPVLTQGSVVNGASYRAGIVPGSWAQVKGKDLAPLERIWQASDFASGNNLPKSLNGVEVKVNNIPAAIYYISPSQISFQAPAGISGSVDVQVVRNGVASNSVSAMAANTAPGIFAYTAGNKTYPAAIFANSPLIVGDPAVSGASVRKASPRDRISLYATGLAPSPAGVTVGVTALSGVTATVGSQEALVEFAGLVAVGQYQINVVVPDLAEGEHQIVIRYDGQASQPDVLIPIGR